GVELAVRAADADVLHRGKAVVGLAVGEGGVVHLPAVVVARGGAAVDLERGGQRLPVGRGVLDDLTAQVGVGSAVEIAGQVREGVPVQVGLLHEGQQAGSPGVVVGRPDGEGDEVVGSGAGARAARGNLAVDVVVVVDGQAHLLEVVLALQAC